MPAWSRLARLYPEPLPPAHPPSCVHHRFTPRPSTPPPAPTQVAFACFTALGALWTLVVVRAKADAHKIHYLMVLLLAVKSLTLLSQAFMFHTISIFGDAEGWNIAFYVLTGVCGGGSSSVGLCGLFLGGGARLSAAYCVALRCGPRALDGVEAMAQHAPQCHPYTHSPTHPPPLLAGLRSMLFFTVAILLAVGWSYMKPFLTRREKNVIVVRQCV